MAISSSSPEKPADPGKQTGLLDRTPGILLAFCLWLGLWALLSGAEGWVFGVPLAALATFAGYRLGLRCGTLRISVLPAFLAFFLRELFSGGWDVACRALHPRLPVAPGWQTFNLTCRDPRVRLLLSALVGLLPGTLSSHHQDQILHIHALDQQQDWRTTVGRLETLLAKLLGDEAI